MQVSAFSLLRQRFVAETCMSVSLCSGAFAQNEGRVATKQTEGWRKLRQAHVWRSNCTGL